MVLRGMAPDWSELEGRGSSWSLVIKAGVAFWKALLLEIRALWLDMETLMHLCFQGLPEQSPMGADGTLRNCRESLLVPFCFTQQVFFLWESVPSSQSSYSKGTWRSSSNLDWDTIG